MPIDDDAGDVLEGLAELDDHMRRAADLMIVYAGVLRSINDPTGAVAKVREGLTSIGAGLDQGRGGVSVMKAWVTERRNQEA